MWWGGRKYYNIKVSKIKIKQGCSSLEQVSIFVTIVHDDASADENLSPPKSQQPSTPQWEIVLVAWERTSQFRFAFFKINQRNISWFSFWLSSPSPYLSFQNQPKIWNVYDHQLHFRTPRCFPGNGFPAAWWGV